MKMNKLLALMLVLVLALSTGIFAYAEDASAIPEIPAELLSEISAAYGQEAAAPSAGSVPAPVFPAVETSQEFVPTLSSHYASIGDGTRLYKTAAKDKLLGAFTGMNTVRVIWQKDYYNETGDIEYSLYQAVFYAGGQRVEGYFYASALGFITLKEEAELLDGSDELKILTADFEFAEEEAPAPDYPCTNINAVNLRKSPSRSAQKVDKLAEGTHVDVIETVTNDAGELWLKVTAADQTGYVLASLVDGYSAPEAEEPAPTEEPVPEKETEEPAADQPEEEPAGDPAPVVRSVYVTFSKDADELTVGTTVTLTAELTGFENTSYTTVWQYCPVNADGEPVGDWQDGEQNSLTHTYTLTESNMGLAWRMRVVITAED